MTTTNEKVRESYEEHRIVRRLSADPSTANLEGGEIWYNTTADEYRGYEAGTGIVSVGTTAV
ncbi:hypothetical protein [Natrinema salifodinae]|uniref:Uncharacterized protein n=1 Tax=Natrinema salifodinae TaxID=1202768 RepID=A0A1I0P7Q2_9EURY|nr:hypothetical protein [Natrinema salifodinae]SEW10379.1 hypothetical protein SAMN05216285_2252 [Natrinema salifodinae]